MNILNEILYYNIVLFISHVLLKENKRFFFFTIKLKIIHLVKLKKFTNLSELAFCFVTQ